MPSHASHAYRAGVAVRTERVLFPWAVPWLPIMAAMHGLLSVRIRTHHIPLYPTVSPKVPINTPVAAVADALALSVLPWPRRISQCVHFSYATCNNALRTLLGLQACGQGRRLLAADHELFLRVPLLLDECFEHPGSTGTSCAHQHLNLQVQSALVA